MFLAAPRVFVHIRARGILVYFAANETSSHIQTDGADARNAGPRRARFNHVINIMLAHRVWIKCRRRCQSRCGGAADLVARRAVGQGRTCRIVDSGMCKLCTYHFSLQLPIFEDIINVLAKALGKARSFGSQTHETPENTRF